MAPGTAAVLGSTLNAGHFRVVEGIEDYFGGHALGRDLELVAAGKQPVAIDAVFRIADITVADRAADRVAVAAAREPAYALAVTIDGFAAEQDDGGIGGESGEQARKRPCGLGCRQLRAPETACSISASRPSRGRRPAASGLDRCPRPRSGSPSPSAATQWRGSRRWRCHVSPRRPSPHRTRSRRTRPGCATPNPARRHR